MEEEKEYVKTGVYDDFEKPYVGNLIWGELQSINGERTGISMNVDSGYEIGPPRLKNCGISKM